MFFDFVHNIVQCLYAFFLADYEKLKFKTDDDVENDKYYITIRDTFEHVLASD
jgi:hypothetical protein